MVLRHAKSVIQAAAKKFGYRIRLLPADAFYPIDLRSTTNDPRSLIYHAGKQPTVLIDAPVKWGYALAAFPLNAEGCHPFIYAIRKAKSSSQPCDTIRAVLRCYYESVQPSNAAQWLGLDPESAPQLQAQPPWARIFPWRSSSISARRRGIESAARFDNRQAGANLSIRDGWKAFGPVSEAVLNIETQRLLRLYESIKHHGLLRNNEFGGDIRGIALVNGDNWRWMQGGCGAHRAPVLSAMGFETIPVRIYRVVFRKHVDLWPQVVSGVYSRENALRVFDRVFQHHVPPIADPWQRMTSSA